MTSHMDLFKHYEDKRVLVAGASGMTGHNLVDMLEYLCCKEVVGTCLNNNVVDEYGKDKFISIDFTNKGMTNNFFHENYFDYVFICCAKTYNAMMCKSNPTSMVLPNIEMASNILENCLKNKVKKVVFVSSATVYQPSFKAMSEEDLDLNEEPNSLYMGVGWAKRYIEKLCDFYRQQGLDVVCVRPTNIYGRYDKVNEKLNHVIPALICRALDRQDPFIVYGNGLAQKDFIHAADFANDLARVMAFYKGGPINVCTGKVVRIIDVVRIILKHVKNINFGYDPHVIFSTEEQDQVPFRALDNSKFKAILGGALYRDIDSGIKDTIEWLSLSRQTQNQ